jgi:glycine cleavage system H protein
MTAGVLSYQLCDRMLECDSCPLDQAIRRQFLKIGEPGSPTPDEPERTGGEQRLREGYRYSLNHCWAVQSEPNLVRVGIEPGLSAALLSPKAVVFPSKGQHLQTGQTCLWIVMDGGTLPLECPVGGVVAATNGTLAEGPHLLRTHPFDEGWLYCLRPDVPFTESPEFMASEQAVRKYAADQSRFLSMVSAAAHAHRGPVGMTLADGGERLRSMADMLGPSRYFNLVRQAFG